MVEKRLFCKKCQWIPQSKDEQSIICPKCGTENGISQKDSIRKMYKKMGLDEPKFYD